MRSCGKLYVRIFSLRSPVPIWLLRASPSSLARFLFQLIQTGTQDLERLILVLDLGFLILAGDDQSARHMRDTHRTIRRVHGLSAGPEEQNVSMRKSLGLIVTSTSSACGKTTTVAWTYGYARLFPFLERAAPDGRLTRTSFSGIPASASAAVDLEHGFFETAYLCLVRVEHLYVPALFFSVVRIHKEEFRSEQAGFIATSATTDFYDNILVVRDLWAEAAA